MPKAHAIPSPDLKRRADHRPPTLHVWIQRAGRAPDAGSKGQLVQAAMVARGVGGPVTHIYNRETGGEAGGEG